MVKNSSFTQDLLAWFKIHGRHDLPWQQNPTPYRVWVSEIMLQQTQVITVIDYYQRFMEQFSSIELLARASVDEALNLWSGLGYYARGRNLHGCAQRVVQKYQGVFPGTVEELSSLPGIGRSTAGAILSLSMQTRATILDGNVKRVLTRFHAVEGFPGDSLINQQLWDLAEQQTPTEHFTEYTQAIMDLGATLCTRHKPACGRCPVSAHCQAYAQSRTHEFPYTKKTKARPKKSTQMLIIQNSQGHLYLEKRPPAGIWGGLWSFPECADAEEIAAWCWQQLNAEIITTQALPVIKHVFSHFELAIQPMLLTIEIKANQVMESGDKIWYNISAPLPGGIAAPIAKLLKQVKGFV